MMRKLDALAAAYPEHYRVVEQTEVSKTYSEKTPHQPSETEKAE